MKISDGVKNELYEGIKHIFSDHLLDSMTQTERDEIRRDYRRYLREHPEDPMTLSDYVIGNTTTHYTSMYSRDSEHWLTIKMCQGIAAQRDGVSSHDVVSKLARYEEADAEGRMFITPCRIGYPVWTFSKIIDVEPGKGIPNKCIDCRYLYQSMYSYVCKKHPEESTGCEMVYQLPFELSMLDEINKTIFLSKEAAEDALKQFQANNQENK